MLHRLIDASLRQRPFLLLVATVSLGIGLWSAYRLPIDAVPDITSPQVQVNTEVLALAPEETEKPSPSRSKWSCPAFRAWRRCGR